MSELTTLNKLKAAVFMVGNIDTPEDKARWWTTFGPLWMEIAKEGPQVQEWADAMAVSRQSESAEYQLVEFLRVTDSKMEQLQTLIENPPLPTEALKNSMSKFCSSYDPQDPGNWRDSDDAVGSYKSMKENKE